MNRADSLDSGYEFRRTKVQFMMEVHRYVEENSLTQAAAARAMKTTRPRLNEVLKGRIWQCSIDRFVQVLAEVGLHVSTKVSKAA